MRGWHILYFGISLCSGISAWTLYVSNRILRSRSRLLRRVLVWYLLSIGWGVFSRSIISMMDTDHIFADFVNYVIIAPLSLMSFILMIYLVAKAYGAKFDRAGAHPDDDIL